MRVGSVACPRLVRLVPLVLVALFALAACGGPPPSREVVRAFYDAALRGDAAAAERCLAGAGTDAAGAIERATRAGTLRAAEIVDSDQWAEHGVVCTVQKTFADGTLEQVRLEVMRSGGVWRIDAAKSRL